MSEFWIRKTFTGHDCIKQLHAFTGAVHLVGGEITLLAAAGVWNLGSLPIQLADVTEITSVTLRRIVAGSKTLASTHESGIDVVAVFTGERVPFSGDDPADSQLPIELDENEEGNVIVAEDPSGLKVFASKDTRSY